MRLHAICYYRSNSETWTDDWSSDDFIARNVVKAIKHKPFNGFSRITCGGRNFRIEDTVQGRSAALEAVALSIVSSIREAGYENAAIVPVPASNHIDPCAAFTGRRIADEIERSHPAFASRPILYFNEALEPAANGGTRNPLQIKRHLRCSGVAMTEAPLILLDDVCTSGGHLRGAKLFLSELGHTVEDAFVVARTVWDRPPSMLNFQTEEL